MLVNSAAWSPGGERIFYGRGRKLSIANSDGSDSRELLDAPGSVSRLFPSPDGRVLVLKCSGRKARWPNSGKCGWTGPAFGRSRRESP